MTNKLILYYLSINFPFCYFILWSEIYWSKCWHDVGVSSHSVILLTNCGVFASEIVSNVGIYDFAAI